MNKIIPLALLLAAIVGLIGSLIGLILVLTAFVVSGVSFVAVLVLVIACIITVFPILGGIIFKEKICKAALIISAIAGLIIFISFILLYSI